MRAVKWDVLVQHLCLVSQLRNGVACFAAVTWTCTLIIYLIYISMYYVNFTLIYSRTQQQNVPPLHIYIFFLFIGVNHSSYFYIFLLFIMWIILEAWWKVWGGIQRATDEPINKVLIEEEDKKMITLHNLNLHTKKQLFNFLQSTKDECFASCNHLNMSTCIECAWHARTGLMHMIFFFCFVFLLYTLYANIFPIFFI